MNFFENIPPGILNFISIFGTITSIALSIVTIICANNIPKALMKYRINADMKHNLENINGGVKRAIDRIGTTNLTKEEFICLFNSVDSMLFEYGKYMEHEFQVKSKILHKEYNKMIKKYEDKDTLNKAETVMLLDQYSQMLNLIRVNTGSVNNEKRS